MDETGAWLSDLIGWVSRLDQPPIYFAGKASTCNTRPAPLLELVYLTEGHMPELVMGPLRIPIRAGQMGLYNVHFGNMNVQETPFVCWCLFLDITAEKRFDFLHRAPLGLVADVQDPARVDRVFGELVARCRATAWTQPWYQPPGVVADRSSPVAAAPRSASLAARTLVKAALLELLGTLLEETHRSTGSGPSMTLPAGLAEAVAWLHRSLDRPGITRQRLAQVAGVHPDHLTRLFRQHLGLAPMRFLTQLRVQQACFLLEHTTERIESIARSVGFEDAFHFSRVFRVTQGVSPRSWREKRLSSSPSPSR